MKSTRLAASAAIAAAATLVVSLGALSPVLAADPTPAAQAGVPGPGSSPEDVRSYLGVTDAQNAKIQAIKKKYDDKVNAVLLQLQQLQAASQKEADAVITPAQKEKLKAIQTKFQQKAGPLQKQVNDLQVQGNNEIAAVWTPEQKDKIRKMREQAAAAQPQPSAPPSR